jgi:hypothetical protein
LRQEALILDKISIKGKNKLALFLAILDICQRLMATSVSSDHLQGLSRRVGATTG